MKRNRSNRKPSVADRAAARISARRETDALLEAAKVKLQDQAEILESLRVKYCPQEIPVPELWRHRAERLEGVCRA